MIAAAACAALVLGVSKIPDLHTVREIAGQKTSSEKEMQGSVIENLEHAFTVKVMAAEKKDAKTGEKVREEKTLIKDVPVPVVPSATSDDECWSGNPDTNMVDYCVEFPVLCEGKNIEKITYTINKGVFQIFSPKDSGYILEGEKCKKNFNTGEITPRKYVDEDGRINAEEYDEGYYTSYTVSPDFQSSEEVQVNICNELKVSKKTFQKLWEFDRPLKVLKEGRDETFGDLTITCEVTYQDGSKESADIAVGTVIMRPSEAGEVVEAPEKDKESVFTTFQMK